MDSAFLDIETSGPAVAVGAVLVAGGEAPTLPEVKKFVSSRLPQMPRFHQRVQASRSKVSRAKWVSVDPDLDHHIKQVVLPPGASYDSVVSDLMEVPMDRKRPLWDAVLVTGYARDEWALIVRLHHSIADGQGALILLGELIDLSEDGSLKLADGIKLMMTPKESAEEPIDLDRRRDEVRAKAIRALDKGFEGLGNFIATSPDTVRSLLALAPKRPTDLTGAVSARRRWVGGMYSLTEVKEARKEFKGVTINDMVLASVAYGFGRLLESRGINPDGRTLRAVMPVSLRKDLAANNQVGILPAPLPVGDMDPMTRMRAIKDSTKHSKRSMLPVISDELLKVTEKVTPAPVQEYVMSNVNTLTGYFSETLVTNVKGPMVPLYVMGRKAKRSVPIIPIEGSMRIIVGITSYMDELTIGVTGDGEYAADVDVLVAGIQAGFDELCNAAAAKSGSSSRTEERKPKPPGKAAVKKAAPKKTASKKSAPKKTASKKSAVKKTASKKSAVKKTASKRTTPPKETSY
jgi:WS/DGAT/MGAT family acyltransferase